ncbi:hypothetical protein JW899_01195 [Candidatus Uhrbacteria bacterium]|nr:hypothetical protein [Candidatus Uhrbacteria bacterium]
MIVVDNGSGGGTVRMVRQRFQAVRLITNDWNSGFAHPYTPRRAGTGDFMGTVSC